MKTINIRRYLKNLAKTQSPLLIHGQETAQGMRTFVDPTINRSIRQTNKMAMHELYGDLDPRKHVYRCPMFGELNNQIIFNEKKYKVSKDQETRIALNQDCVKSWKKFLDSAEKTLPEEMKLNEITLIKLKDIFSRFKNRTKHTISSEEVLPFHNEFTKCNYLFDIPFHPKNLAMMLHPHWGYFCKFKGREFTFEDIVNFYKKEVVSSHYRNQGLDFISHRLSAFNYWSIMDTNLKGFLTHSQFIDLLDAMTIDSKGKTHEQIKSEFESVLERLKFEFLDDSSAIIYRFRFFEFIFLQRCSLY